MNPKQLWIAANFFGGLYEEWGLMLVFTINWLRTKYTNWKVIRLSAHGDLLIQCCKIVGVEIYLRGTNSRGKSLGIVSPR